MVEDVRAFVEGSAEQSLRSEVGLWFCFESPKREPVDCRERCIRKEAVFERIEDRVFGTSLAESKLRDTTGRNRCRKRWGRNLLLS